MYELLTQGAVDLARYTSLLETRKIIRDPLSGPINSSNTIFTGNYPPALASGSTAIFLGTVAQTGYSFIADNAQFTLSSAPATGAAQIYGNYTFSSLAPDVVTKILFLGFDHMESLWARGFRLSGSAGVYVPAVDTDSAVYIVSSSDNADPVASGLYFSASRTQIAFFMKSAQYAYYSQRLYEEAAGGMSYKEAGGMAVDTTSRARNINLLLDRLERELMRMLATAQADWLENLGGFAAVIHSPQSGDYRSNLKWQDGTGTTFGGLYRGNVDGEAL